MNRLIRNLGFYLLVVLIAVGIVKVILTTGVTQQPITYDQFRQYVVNKQISTVAIRPEGLTYRIEGSFAADRNQTFITYAPFSDVVVEELNHAPEVKVEWQPQREQSLWLTSIVYLVPSIIMFLLFFFFINQAQGGGSKVMNFGKSRARLYTGEKKRVTFADVAGADEEKAELVEVVEFLKDPRKFSLVGARIPKGVLLVGPPGTGKTLLARAVAGEAGVPFFSISGSDFVEMFVGVGASRVRDLFENAKKNSPCIVFIDEIDAVGRQRGAGLGGGHDEREQTLNQLLVEMDGFGANEGIIVVAATNRPDILDPALLRPGRFDRQITVDRPDVKGREAILKVHARNKPLDDSVKLEVIAKRSPGFTGADLENLLNEAALLTARRDKKKVSMAEIEEAIDRVIAGPAKTSRVISELERKIVAYHEAGHTVVGYHLKNADMVHKVTIIPRGSAGGYTVMLPKEDRFFMRKGELLEKVVGLLGGRVAEEITFGEVSTGAHNDFQRATEIVRRMVTEFGMSEKLGPMQFGHTSGQPFLGRDFTHEQNYSEAIAFEIDKEMQRFISESYDRCKAILTEHSDQLELIAQTLLVKETLDEEEIKRLMEHGKLDVEEIDKQVKINIQSKDNNNQLNFNDGDK